MCLEAVQQVSIWFHVQLSLVLSACVLTAGDDFNGTSPLHKTFSSGSKVGARLYFDIPIFDDEIVEDDEFFSVVLNDTGLMVHIKTSYIQITDNDSK